jgi:hypothetical protein
MKAYIDTKSTTRTTTGVLHYYAELVDEYDYHDGGPFAHSHRTALFTTEAGASEAARRWGEKHGYTIVDAREI